MPKWEINNFKGVVRDTGAGKQPEGTIADSTNLVLHRKRGSLVQRWGLSASGVGTKPSALSVLDHHLCFPVTQPSSSDQHVYFGQDSNAAKHIWCKPYYHNSATAGTGNDGWVDISETKTFTPAGDQVISIDPANSITMEGADTCASLGLETTSQYYKNWVMIVDDTNGKSVWFIKSYFVSGGYASFYLDSIIDVTTGDPYSTLKACSVSLYRYFHIDRSDASPFTPSYTDPAGYSSDLAVRFSGGKGSTVGYKNIKYGYLSKTFFPSVTSRSHAFQGSYCDQAECKAPSSALLKSATMTAPADMFSHPTVDSLFTANGTNWEAVGGAEVVCDIVSNSEYGTAWALRINFYNTDAGASKYVLLDGELGTLLIGTTYTFGMYIANASEVTLNVVISGTSGTPATAKFSLKQNADYASFSFTGVAGTGSIKMYTDNIPAEQFLITGMSLIATASKSDSLAKNKTYRLYSTFVYDGFQESELTYLAQNYLSAELYQYVVTITTSLANLNKFITSIRLYLSADDGDTTTSSNTVRNSPAMLVADIPVSSATTGWSFSATTGKYEYTKTITDFDINNSESTWEQKTGRVASASTTCSYSIAAPISGRVMIAQEYDYADAREYTNRLRYTGFSGSGVMCPDIFPNINDSNISDISQGAGTNIQSIIDYNGNTIIHKDSSTVAVTTSDSTAYWRTEIISQSIGATNKHVVRKVGKSVVWCDGYDIYSWNGGEPRSLGDGIWREYYQANKGTFQRAWVDNLDNTYNLIIAGSNSDANQYNDTYYKIDIANPFPMKQTIGSSSLSFKTIAVSKSGVAYFGTASGLSIASARAGVDGTYYVRTYFDTGTVMPSPKSFINIEEIFFDVEVDATVGGTWAVSLSVDGTTVTLNPPAITSSSKFIRIKVPAHKAGRYFRITWGGVASGDMYSTGCVTINRVGIIYSSTPEYGDVR